MIEIPITEDMLLIAKEKAADMGILRNSIKRGKGNEAGFLGEISIIYACPRALWENTYDYDVDIDGLKFDVKTKERNVPPQDDYLCSVAAYNTTQKADGYIFVSLLRREKAYIVGYLPKNEYFKRARFSKAGSYEAENNYTEHVSAYKLRIKDLLPVEELFALTR